MDPFPTKFPAYEMLEELGRGTTGVVFAVRDPRLNCDLALKAVAIVNEDERPVRTARLPREARVLAYLTSGPHEDIPKLHAVSEHEGQAYYIRGLVDGQTLEQMVSAGMIDLGAGIRILREVANIVGRVHAHGVAHRNLHASNVLVPAAGGPKLIGFGKCGFLAAPDAPATDSGGVRSDVRDLQQMLDRLCTTLGGPVPACLAGVRQPGSMETTDEFSEALAQWLENEEGNTNGD